MGFDMGGESPIRPQIYTRFFSVRFKPEDVEKLNEIARKKGYYSKEGSYGNKLKQPRTGVTRVIREIVEEFLTKSKPSLDK